MNNFPLIFNFSLAFSGLYVVASVAYLIAGFPYRLYVLGSSLIPIIFLAMRFVETRRFIDIRLRSFIQDLDDYSVYTKSLPGFRYADIYNAVQTLSQTSRESLQIDSRHAENLSAILTGQFYLDKDRRINTAEKIARPISEGQEGFFSVDNFWLQAPSKAQPGRIVRVRLHQHTHEVILEVAASLQEHAERIIDQVLKHASKYSIFKNKLIAISFEQEVKDTYGDIERYEKIDPVFIAKPPVMDQDIILDEDTKKVIQRTIINFHERREDLMRAGLPGRRGILFYGPPGTGKTYTCRYISQRLGSATTIMTAGASLLHMKSICNIARMLQPSIVVLEDVDLVYGAREGNVHTTALGELMDELDGFHPDDSIIFILTTNAIDRVELAISERPGRISQCIYFGPPNPELRRRYLTFMLARYDCAALNMDDLLAKTKGVTQAFLKELVYRAVQIACESVTHVTESLMLTDEHFSEALAEMQKSTGDAGRTIIGFLGTH